VKPHEIAFWVVWHGRLMVLAWVGLLPLGVLIARYCKVTRRQDWPRQLDNKFWWHSHLGLQYSGIAAMSVAALLAWRYGDLRHSAQPLHGLVGWAVVTLGWLQVFGGLLRGSKGGPQPTAGAPIESAVRGDHYDMTARRRNFERLHKSVGYLALLLSLLAVGLGLRVADAPAWMGWAIGCIWASGLSVFVYLQRAGRCIDTYQAIWGPGAGHPGNRQNPIGIGVRRSGTPRQADPVREHGE
jgi:hypothetical protein